MQMWRSYSKSHSIFEQNLQIFDKAFKRKRNGEGEASSESLDLSATKSLVRNELQAVQSHKNEVWRHFKTGQHLVPRNTSVVNPEDQWNERRGMVRTKLNTEIFMVKNLIYLECTFVMVFLKNYSYVVHENT